jgi:hypothetical protein
MGKLSSRRTRLYNNPECVKKIIWTYITLYA